MDPTQAPPDFAFYLPIYFGVRETLNTSRTVLSIMLAIVFFVGSYCGDSVSPYAFESQSL